MMAAVAPMASSCQDKLYDERPMNLDRYFPEVVGRRVLDVGCGTGNLGAALQQRGNQCYGITMSPAEAEAAKSQLTDVLLGDVDTWASLPFPRGFFDVVIFADVLEHLRHPQQALRLVRPYLASGAQVIASIPNVANLSVRWNLLCGRFHYEPAGILDNTHLRFYTLGTARALLTETGYQVHGVRFTHWNWCLPQPLRALVADREWEVQERMTRWWPGLLATQFILYAHPADQTAGHGDVDAWRRW